MMVNDVNDGGIKMSMVEVHVTARVAMVLNRVKSIVVFL